VTATMKVLSLKSPAAALRLPGLLLFSLALAACGSGNSSEDDGQTPPPEPPPETTPTTIDLLDSIPRNGATQVDPALAEVTLAHFGYADLAIDISGACVEGVTLERSLVDVSVDFDALFEHNQVCSTLTDNGAFETSVSAQRDSGDSYTVSMGFSTTTAVAPALQVQDSVSTPRDSVADMFQTFVDEALIAGLELPDAVASVVEASVDTLVDAAYGRLMDPEPLFGVTAQRVAYASRQPDGTASSELSGLVVVPDTSASGFTPRDSIIVLSHSTGVTPSNLDAADGWYAVANILAGRGYLVIAPDNWGRGLTSTEPETFLMASRTAANSLDLILAVLADPQYDAASPESPTVTVVGYSQGGHTALAIWQTLAAQARTIEVPRVYAGAGPYNLYATARGVVRHAAGLCDDDAYCRYATDETSVPFLSERVLPGYAAYADESLMLSDLVDGDALTQGFVDGFLANEPAFDRLKGLLQQSSFTNITGGLDELSDAGTIFTLFHSKFDRLVPIANSEELAAVLEAHYTVDLRTESCDSIHYEAIFNATDQVGISHTLCGFEMLNDVYGELR
jgi:pimeloyl-ACP methyl ester carboxylesterase